MFSQGEPPMDRNTKLQLSENSLKVLERRYLAKDGEGRSVETPEDLFRRVADALAESDRLYGADDAVVQETARTFHEKITSLEFMPNSPTLMNAGRPLGQLSACFVLPVGDSMEEIFEAIKHAALIHKSGGGTGFAFSRLRPRNSIVASTSGVASGPVSFMKVFNAATEAVKQGGTRRGANMGILRVDHPDIMEFVSCKDDLTQITNFNISVAITDAFMKAVEHNTSYDLLDPRTCKPYTIEGEVLRLDAREVFESIVDHAWKTGEPGVVFIDQMNRDLFVTRAAEGRRLGAPLEDHSNGRSFPRQRHRREQLPHPGNQTSDPAQPPHRSGRDGLGGHAGDSARAVQLRGGPGVGRGDDALH